MASPVQEPVMTQPPLEEENDVLEYLAIPLALGVLFVVPFGFRMIMQKTKMSGQGLRVALKKFLMSIPRWVMMIIMAIPEQLVLYFTYSTAMSTLIQRLTVSVAMYLIHFGWNGMIPKPPYSYNELPWILGTALYAFVVIGTSSYTAAWLLAADSIMVLTLRGITAEPMMKKKDIKEDTENKTGMKENTEMVGEALVNNKIQMAKDDDLMTDPIKMKNASEMMADPMNTPEGMLDYY